MLTVKSQKSKVKGQMSKKGFTLIEILVVVAIIGLLASIVLVGLGSFRARGRDARRIADLREVQNALELYYTKYSSYPQQTGWSELVTALQSAGIGVSKIPDNGPLGPNDDPYKYCYITPEGLNNPQGYVLGAKLEDSKNPALNNDLDIASCTGGNIDCGDPEYCVQF